MTRLLAVFLLAAAPAAAQEQEASARCGLHDQMAEGLLQRYDESPIASFVEVTGIEHEWFGSPTGSWTILVNLPDGVSCAVAHGTGTSLGPMPGLGKPL